MDKDSGRARELILQSASAKDINIRRACIEMLPKLYSEEVLRGIATDLLKTEKDTKLRQELTEMTIDESLEGSESQKNKFLAPAPSVPKLDREVAEAHGMQLGLEKLPVNENDLTSKQSQSKEDRIKEINDSLKKEAEKNNPLYRSVSQDEMMGYEDEFDLIDLDEEEF
jgi:hypothetical protein